MGTPVAKEKHRKLRFLLFEFDCLTYFSCLPQIFGICLAQNLVSDIEAVRASW